MTYSNATSLEYQLEILDKYLNQDDSITEIAVNRPCEVWYEKHGTWYRDELLDLTYDKCLNIAIAAASFSKNDFNDKVPILSAVLPNKVRSQFVMPPACEDSTISITIRKPSKQLFSLEYYRKSGFFNQVLPLTGEISTTDQQLLTLLEEKSYEEFLVNAVKQEKNIIVAGATGSGKTTFMKTLNEQIPTTDRIITIEDVPELFLPNHPNHVHLFYPSSASEDSAVTPAALLKSCLRMKPHRILLAELRGAEAWDFIQICASGHGGSITSLHAGNVAEVFERLVGMYLSNPHGQSMQHDIIMRQLLMTIDVIVHMSDRPEIGRSITQIYFDPRKKLGVYQ
jgi:type IV secretion system protein VirB11